MISRETGEAVRTFVAETFFYLHTINQFETRDKEYIVLDICCYRDSKMLEYMYIDSMKVCVVVLHYDKLYPYKQINFTRRENCTSL